MGFALIGWIAVILVMAIDVPSAISAISACGSDIPRRNKLSAKGDPGALLLDLKHDLQR